MKHARKLVTLIIVLAMVMAFMVPSVMAQTVGTVSDGTGSITITNAAKGETYAVYKVFDATVTGTTDGSIAYKGTIPSELETYFEADASGNISAKENINEANLFAALKTWAKTATATASVESDGTALTFAGLDYGYYVITSTQASGAAISVDSTNPDATVTDKNSSVPNDLTKTVNDDDVSLGQEVTYTVKFKTANYDGADTTAKKIVSYTIQDTLPEFLSLGNNAVQSIIVDDDGDVTTTTDQTSLTVRQFDSEKKIVINWIDADQNSLYKNGAYIILTYKATVTASATINGTENTNTVTVTWNNTDGLVSGKQLIASATIKTYSFDLIKTDSDGKVLDNATFKLYDAASGGNEIAVVADGTNYRKAIGSETGVEITAGKVTISGLASGTYYLEEIAPPAGYNKLSTRTAVTIDKANNSVTMNGDVYDKGGIQIINQKGTELPSTGGIGTTIFYILGGILAVGALVVLITNKRMRGTN